LKLYNTMSGKKEEFVPHRAGHVNMYVCGPTVYDFVHVGNMRVQVVFDSLRRYLLYKGLQVTMVQNFTDVDDKIIARAAEEGLPSSEVAEKYIRENFADSDNMAVCRANAYPRVTDEMDSIIAMVGELVAAGKAYENAGHVFFDAQNAEGYGKLSKKNVDDLLAGARVEVSDLKRSPVDFVLWKPAKDSPNEPFWESPWGAGRPGWHIECSAMVRKFLGYVDIHGGGADLIFPHHENEIAQSEALQSEPFAKYWMHVGMLTNGHKKMSKSLGNFFTLRETAEKFPHELIRFFLISGHYRMPMEYSEALLESAQKALERIKNCRALLLEAADDKAELPKEAESFKADFEARLDDDFNTADAVAVIFELVRFANTRLHEGGLSGSQARGVAELIDSMCGLLGLSFAAEESDVDAEIEALIAERQAARAAKDWAAADQIRDTLAEKGIVLEDTPSGVRWTRK